MFAGQQTRGKLGSNGGFGRGRVLARTGPLDHLHRQATADVAGDQQFLD
jgi:hypothetical protein